VFEHAPHTLNVLYHKEYVALRQSLDLRHPHEQIPKTVTLALSDTPLSSEKRNRLLVDPTSFQYQLGLELE